MSTTAIAIEEPFLIERSGGVVRLTLNRPQRRNALSRGLIARIENALDEIAGDAEARVVVLAAAGPIFCSGHDLGEMRGQSDSLYQDLFSSCSRMMFKLRQIPQPVIARVQGLATAAGCQLAASCDLIVAAESATFATPGVKIGLFCTTPMVPLVRSLPPKVAMEMLLTGTPLPARRAYELGMVNRVVPVDQLDAVIEEYTRAIVETSPLTVRIGKAAFYDQLALAEEDAYTRATQVMCGNAMAGDAQEGIAAFLEKRRPEWTGH